MSDLAWRHSVAVILSAAIAIASCSGSDDPKAVSTRPDALTLVSERKFSALLGAAADRYEASGIVAKDGSLYVVFDNMSSIAVVDQDLSQATLGPGSVDNSQFEGIAYDNHSTPHFYVVVEMDNLQGEVAVFDDQMARSDDESTDVTFTNAKRGLEGVAWVRANNDDYLLALCEGNLCADDTEHRGNGRIKVLRQESDGWRTEAELVVPSDAAFKDYSDLALRARGDGSMAAAIVSQESSALWIGTLTMDPWKLTTTAVYSLPRGAGGEVRYCQVEGVTFINETTIAMVSDASTDSDQCSATDESVHVFSLP